jgi:predicted PurR-regulated permease PerM
VRWARALAVGLQAVAWWLRRKTQNPTTWATLGLGVVVAVAAYWAGAALSSTVLSPLAIAETPHATTSGWSAMR